MISFFTANNSCIGSVGWSIIYFIFIVGTFFVLWLQANHTREARFKINNTHIEVKIGDIFELMEKEQEQRKDELAVIGVNNYYDDDVDDRIVAAIVI